MKIYDRLTRLLLVDETQLPDLTSLSAAEHFIPIYFEDILEKALMDERLTDDERKDFQALAEMFAEHYHLDYHETFLRLKSAFGPFDPDAEILYRKDYSEEFKESCRKNLLEGLEVLLTACNYCELTEEKRNEILKAPYPGVLSIAVDMKKLNYFRIFYRGLLKKNFTVRKFFFLKKSYDSHEFKRIFVLARYKKEYGNQIITKIFRDVPAENLKVVVPEVKLRLPILDQVKVGASFSGTIVAFIVKGVLVTVKAAAAGLWACTLLFYTFIMGAFRSVTGFFTSRMKCLKTYSESLYHQSLAGNMGAVNLLVEQAETQEVKEAFLAYFMLYLLRDETLTEKRLDEHIEAWLEKNFGFYIDFEVDDALRKLVEKNLIKKFTPEDGSEPYYKVYDLPSALRRLDEIWDNYHTENNEGQALNDALAS